MLAERMPWVLQVVGSLALLKVSEEMVEGTPIKEMVVVWLMSPVKLRVPRSIEAVRRR